MHSARRDSFPFRRGGFHRWSFASLAGINKACGPGDRDRLAALRAAGKDSSCDRAPLGTDADTAPSSRASPPPDGYLGTRRAAESNAEEAVEEEPGDLGPNPSARKGILLKSSPAFSCPDPIRINTCSLQCTCTCAAMPRLQTGEATLPLSCLFC